MTKWRDNEVEIGMTTNELVSLACINCTHSQFLGREIPAGWTRVRPFKDDEEDTVWFTHVGYCPAPECQMEAAEEAKRERLLFT